VLIQPLGGKVDDGDSGLVARQADVMVAIVASLPLLTDVDEIYTDRGVL
jgi:hypothetical protein